MNYMEKSNQFTVHLASQEIEVLIHSAEEGGFWGECPSFPGCITEGESQEEIIENIKEIIGSFIITKNKI